MHEPLVSAASQHEKVAAYSQRQIIRMTQEAQKHALELLDEAASMLRPGVTEAEMQDAVQALCGRFCVTKNWHRAYVHFGPHTILTAYDAKTKGESRTLGENDIAYIDLGPVVEVDGVEIEGDVGQTYVFGDNPLHHDLKTQCERIFHRAVAYWNEEKPTGVDLYGYIGQLTKEAGYVFHLEPAGHLIGSFPHIGWKEGLNTYPYYPEPGIWILEIQIRHPEQPYGAFYEAILV